MRVSAMWLREWAAPPLSNKEMAEQLTMAGLEVTDCRPAARLFHGVVVAEVAACKPHPRRPELRLCRVRVGQGTGAGSWREVVSDATTLQVGARLALALPGATLPDGSKVAVCDIAGTRSEGKFCTAAELELTDTADGLLRINCKKNNIGVNLWDFYKLDDDILELALTPNRGDCLSTVGLAREVALLNRLSPPQPQFPAAQVRARGQRPLRVSDPAACPRYVGRLLTGVDAGAPLPVWLSERLRRAGQRRVNAVVDIVNYVMLELGQPLHAFDNACLQGAVQVRRAGKRDSIALLDGGERQLREDALVIADDRRPLALAGIMGGRGSAVTLRTREVFLESAYFAPAALAGQARRYGLHTDASHRFERGSDPELPRPAMERATALILEFCGGNAAPAVEYCSPRHLPKRRPIRLRRARLQRVLGAQLPDLPVVEMLTGLRMAAQETRGGWRVTPPSFRGDIEEEIDLIEELLRVPGFERIPTRLPVVPMTPGGEDPLLRHSRRLRRLLAARGYCEALSYSFLDADWLRSLRLAQPPPLEMDNPISEELAVLRTSLWPGLLQILRYNCSRQRQRMRLFECGTVFSSARPREELRLGGLIYGNLLEDQWNIDERLSDFYDMKQDVQALLGSCDGHPEYRPLEHPALHPRQAAEVCVGGRNVGWLGQLHPESVQRLELPFPPWLFELRLAPLLDRERPPPRYRPISRFPWVQRDLALLVPEEVPVAAVLKVIRDHCPPGLLAEAELFDVFRGESVEEGLKSLAIRLIFQKFSDSLTNQEVEDCLGPLVAVLEQAFGAKLRS